MAPIAWNNEATAPIASSHFVLKTDFNLYARLWAGWIMKDIQNNILQVIQTRCQQNL